MKNFLAILASALFVVFSFVRCSDDDDNNFYPDFVNIPVSVVYNGGDVKFVSDDDVVLIPVNSHDYSSKFWENNKRVFISFRSNAKSFEAGKEYSIELGGSCYAVPLYACHDLAVVEKDTLTGRSMDIKSLKVNDKAFAFVANGFLNIIPSFYYNSRTTVSFGLFCNTDKDVNADSKNIDVNLYFNSNSPAPTLTMSGALVSFELPADFAAIMRNGGLAQSDSVNVSLHYSALDSDNDVLVIPVKVEDLEGVR